MMIIAFLAGMLQAGGSPAALPPQVLSGDMWRSANDGEFVLADVLAPRSSEVGFKAQPHASASAAALHSLLLQLENIVFDDVSEPDRWGRRVGYASGYGDRTADNFQSALVKAGAVRVAPSSDRHEAIAALLVLEGKARSAGWGVWSYDAYAIVDALSADEAIGTYALVEGVVRKTEIRRGRIYLNFGDDYRNDFTVTVRASTARRWPPPYDAIEELAGRNVRVRGSVEAINGPSIELTHPLQLEVLSPPDKNIAVDDNGYVETTTNEVRR